MDIKLICTTCHTHAFFHTSIEAFDAGWELDGVRICPACVGNIIKKANEDNSNSRHTQQHQVDRTYAGAA
jgi:hypothetical protein